VLNPRQFFDQYVMPCVTDWELDPLNIRKALIAISQIDILADHVIIHQHPGFSRVQIANMRKATEQNTPIRLLVRDVHDTHKHGPLQRPTAPITTDGRVLEIVQDDGTKHFVENVINDALTYWEGELISLGL
jgi:hypothetical protein